MNALLVWPRFDSFSFWNFEKVCELAGVKYMTPPLGLLTVAALLPPEWTLRVVDENVRPLLPDDFDWAELVLVSSKIVHRGRALEVVAEARRCGKPVVVGGPDPTMSPDLYRRAGANFLCLDEGEATIGPLLADLARGSREGVYRADHLPDLTKSPVPRFDLVDLWNYLYVGVQYSRGCPYRCEFCNVVDLFQNRYRTKTLDQVLAEFDRLYALGYRGQVDFVDDNLVGHFEDVKPFLRGIAGWLRAHRYPFQLSSSVTMNVAKDPEVLDLLRETRVKFMLVGIETPDEEALRRANKPHNTGFSIAEAADAIYRRAGATIHSGFLLGLDGEPDDVGDRIIQCIDAAAIPWVMAGVVYPLPGTQLARRLDREGRLFPRARTVIDEGARDQISAGLQFKPQRPARAVLVDLLRVMRHAFDPAGYFARCASVASRLNTVPKLLPHPRVLWRNLTSAVRILRAMVGSRTTRRPFLAGLWRVLRKNPVGIESYFTLAALYAHFESMLPYCYEQLGKQIAALDELGEAGWLDQNLGRPEGRPVALPAASAPP